MSAAAPAGTDFAGDLLDLVSHTVRVRRDQLIVSEGEAADSVYVVVEGMVRLYKLLPDGRRQITGFAGPGDLVGAVLDDRYRCSADAMTGALLRRADRACLLKLMDAQPTLMRRLMLVTLAQVSAARRQVSLLGINNAAERVYAFLCTLREPSAGATDDAQSVFLTMGRSDMADYLGLTNETISRALLKLTSARRIHLVGVRTVRFIPQS